VLKTLEICYFSLDHDVNINKAVVHKLLFNDDMEGIYHEIEMILKKAGK